MTLVADFNPAVAVTFQRMRALFFDDSKQEGVLGAGDLKGSQRGLGANLSADVAVGAAWVTIDTGARNGGAHIYNDAVFNAGPFSAGHATLPRIDQVVLRYNDSAIPTGAGNTPTIEVLTGTATSGATLDNRLGATALPNDCMRLCDVLMPTVVASVTTANIRDRRPWARGAYRRLVRNANAAAGNDYTFTTATLSDIDATNLSPRIECSGSPLRVSLRGRMIHSTAGGFVGVSFTVDGAYVDGATSTQAMYMGVEPAASGDIPLNFSWEFLPAAGSHVIRPQALANAATGSILARATNPLLFTVEEIVRASADNT